MTLKVGSSPPSKFTHLNVNRDEGNIFAPAPLPTIVMVTRYLRWIGLLVAPFLAVNTAAEESHVRARLVADVAELRAGESFRLGVLLEPEPGWHVYWRNPGEAGLATEIDYDLPEGFVHGGLGWPAPVHFEQPGGLAGYGYEDPVVLAAEVTASGAIGSSAPVTLEASWLACKDVCVLGSAVLEAELPLGGAELTASRTALKTWSERVPTALEPDLAVLTVTGGPVPVSGSVDLVVWVNWKAAPGAVEFFPDPGSGLKVEDLRARTRDKVTRIDLRIARLKGSSTSAEGLRSLIVIEDDSGERSGWITHIELD